MILTKNVCALRGGHAKLRVRTRTTCRRHITREFGLKSRKKNWGGGENREKKIGGEQR